MDAGEILEVRVSENWPKNKEQMIVGTRNVFLGLCFQMVIVTRILYSME